MSETPQEIVDRVFRENRRYTGDGLPGEPQNAPLPVGDPASGPHNPKKADMRAALLAPLSEAAQSASEAADEKTYAEEWAQSPDPISEEAGGDGATDRSAKWWATMFTERFRQAWNDTANYLEGEVVQFDGNLWIALQNNTNSEPTEGADWSLLLAGGGGVGELFEQDLTGDYTPEQQAQARDNTNSLSRDGSDWDGDDDDAAAFAAVLGVVRPVLIGEIDLGGTNTVQGFTSIPQDFSTLVLKIWARATAASPEPFRMIVNGDRASDAYSLSMISTISTTVAGYGSDATQMAVLPATLGSGAPAGTYGYIEAVFHGYSDAARKTILEFLGVTKTDFVTRKGTATINNSDTVTSISFWSGNSAIPPASLNTLAAGSKAELWGL